MAANQDTAEEEKKFKEMLTLLRKKKRYNFAVRIGGEPRVVLEVDKKKKPAALRKIAKVNGGGPKVVSGKIFLAGKVITIETIEDEYPGALPKLMKTYFKDMKQAFRVEIVAGSADESGAADDDEDDEVTEASGRQPAESEAQEPATPTQQETAAEEAEDELSDAGVETSSAAAPGQTETPAPSAPSGAAAQEQAPAGRTSEQKALLSGLRDMQALLQQVGQKGSREDVARMQKFGGLFKKAVKQDDSRIGHKVLDGMRQLAAQVDVKAKETQKRRKARSGRLKQMRSGMQNLIRELS